MWHNVIDNQLNYRKYYFSCAQSDDCLIELLDQQHTLEVTRSFDNLIT